MNMNKLAMPKKVPHTVLCEISLGWADVCDCGADTYNQSLKRQREALKLKRRTV
jgi:hypothetical protein